MTQLVVVVGDFFWEWCFVALGTLNPHRKLGVSSLCLEVLVHSLGPQGRALLCRDQTVSVPTSSSVGAAEDSLHPARPCRLP